jgi:hypothetical protein
MRFDVQRQKHDPDSVPPRHPDDPLAVQVVLIGLRMPRRRELAGRRGQEAAATGNPFSRYF